MEPNEGGRGRVLIVDDELAQRSSVSRMIERWGFSTETAGDGVEALQKLEAGPFDAIVTDLMMPGMDGMELLRRLRDEQPARPATLVLTAYGNIDTAITMVHDYGAFWFVEKPIRPRAFRVLLERAINQNHLERKSERLERELSSHGVLGQLVGGSRAMQEVYFFIRQCGPTKANVLITGESGTGKELAARAIHDLSPRRTGPFVPLNCAALPEALIESELFGHEKGSFTGALTQRAGCFEMADGGTLLLDEIGDMPVTLQAKLLRVIEDRRVRRLGATREISVDVRVIASTNCDLEKRAKTGQFREDLFFRLAVLHLKMPALRDRAGDIPTLCGVLISALNAAHATRITGVDSAALEVLCGYDWRGNVRQLRNVLERGVILAHEGELTVAHLPPALEAARPERVTRHLGESPSLSIPVGTTLDQAERELIEITLLHAKYNQTRAAELLGISQKTLYNKLKGYGSMAPDT